MLREQPTTDHNGTAAVAPSDLAEAAEAAPACTQGEAARAMEREQPTADHDLAEVAEAPAPACAQDNESDGAQPRSKLARRLSSRLHIGNDATRRDTAKGGKEAAKNSPHAASPTRLAGFSTLRRLRAARPATPHAPKTVNC